MSTVSLRTTKSYLPFTGDSHSVQMVEGLQREKCLQFVRSWLLSLQFRATLSPQTVSSTELFYLLPPWSCAAISHVIEATQSNNTVQCLYILTLFQHQEDQITVDLYPCDFQSELSPKLHCCSCKRAASNE